MIPMLEPVVQILRRHQEDPALFDKVVRGTFAYGSPEMQLITDAKLIANEAHHNDTRHSGEAYNEHPKLVAVIGMVYLGVTDPFEIAGDLVHDVPEDHEDIWPISRIQERLGREVAEATDWVNRRRFDYIPDKDEAHRQYFQSLYNRAPLRPVRMKLCDVFHNVLTPWNLGDQAWVARRLHDLREHYIPLGRKHGVLYQELIHVAQALEQGICLLPPPNRTITIPQ